MVLITTSILCAQQIPFEPFNKNRIDVGTLYVYEYSKNKEDFEPGSKGYLYIKTLSDIEIEWVPVGDSLSTYIVKYKLNWDYMMLERTEFRSLKDKNHFPLYATLEGSDSIDFEKKTTTYKGIYKVKNGFKEKNSIHKIKSVPTYFYRLTDLTPLWFALRFYPLNKDKIIVNHYTNGYNTDLVIKYEGRESVDVPFGNVTCHKFELIPKLSFLMRLLHKSKKMFIWLTSEDSSRYMVKYKNDNEQSSLTQSIEYRLAERRKMTPVEWEKFKEQHRKKDVTSTN